MEQSEYLTAIAGRLDKDYQAICSDCGSKCKIIHAIVDHDENSVKVVCHGCYLDKYLGQDSHKGK